MKVSKIALHSSTSNSDWDLVYRYSKWSKRLRVTACYLQASGFFRQSSNRELIPIWSSYELGDAAKFWARSMQKRELRFVIWLTLNSWPRIRFWYRFILLLDKEALLHLEGRIRHAIIIESLKTPLILPRHTISYLIIKQIHLNVLHGGLQLTLRMLRQQYWILNARSLVKSMLV